MNENITFEKLAKLVSNLEAGLKIQYKQQKLRYNQDFTDEKSFLKKILYSATKGLDRTTKTALLTDCSSTAYNFGKFLCNRRLPRLIVNQLQIVDQITGIIRCALHRQHS